VPVIHVVGAPSLAAMGRRMLLHHTLPENILANSSNFRIFYEMSSRLCCDSAYLNKPASAAADIDRVIISALHKRQPVTIYLPQDIVDHPVPDAHAPLAPPDGSNLEITFFDSVAGGGRTMALVTARSDETSLTEATELAAMKINNAEKPVFIFDVGVHRFNLQSAVLRLLERCQIPFATHLMGKGVIGEDHPCYLGHYIGRLSETSVRQRVEDSDCLVVVGACLSDVNTGFFTSVEYSIEVHQGTMRVGKAWFTDVSEADALTRLTDLITPRHFDASRSFSRTSIASLGAEEDGETEGDTPLSNHHFYLNCRLPAGAVIVAETGTPMMALSHYRLPKGGSILMQPLWCSIGWSVGAVVGAAIAAHPTHAPSAAGGGANDAASGGGCDHGESPRVFLFIGDGSLQVAAQELSTLVRCGLPVVVFVINNRGYTIERVVHPSGAHAAYNDVQNWDYCGLLSVFGGQRGVRVETLGQLREAMAAVVGGGCHVKGPMLVEVVIDQMDVPEGMMSALAEKAKMTMNNQTAQS